jgi:hypothetical protein
MESEVLTALRELELVDAGEDAVELFHATTKENAKAIKESGLVKLDELGLAYFSTSAEIADDLYMTGRKIDAVVIVELPVRFLEMRRDWRQDGGNRLDLVLTRPRSESYYPVKFIRSEDYSGPT